MSQEPHPGTALQPTSELNIGKLVHPFHLLLKALAKLQDDSSAEAIHATRTAVRKVESILETVDADQEHSKLLRSVSRLRKRTGKVRDADIMLSMAASLASKSFPDEETDCQARLVRRLKRERRHQLKKLHRSLDRHETRIRSGIKQSSRKIRSLSSPAGNAAGKRHLRDGGDNCGKKRWNAAVSTREEQLLGELAGASRESLREDQEQLHRYRRKVRELRLFLHLHEEFDSEFANCLGEAKDAIGLWHDWALLHQFASSEIDPECEVTRQIAATERHQLDLAVQSITRIHRNYLGRGTLLPRG